MSFSSMLLLISCEWKLIQTRTAREVCERATRYDALVASTHLGSSRLDKKTAPIGDRSGSADSLRSTHSTRGAHRHTHARRSRGRGVPLLLVIRLRVIRLRVIRLRVMLL